MLLDTSGLLCYHHRDELGHTDADLYFHSADRRVTHNYVLAELVPLCQVRGLNRIKALQFIADLSVSPLVEMVWVDESLHQQAVAYLQARLDKRYSLCDVVSFLVMQQMGLSEALTTDHHFEQAGFRKLLP